jgi:hypothetical protein
MTPILVAVAVGLAIGLVRGGSFRRLARARIHWLVLLPAGVVLQYVGGQPGLLVGYGLLTAFAARNVAWRGMGVVIVGIVLNVAPILLDGGMPVEGHAIVSARMAAAADVPNLDIGGKRHLAHAGDHLRALDDTIPDPVTHEVVSFGDLVIAVGIAAVISGLLQ